MFIDNSTGLTSTLAYLHGAAGFITGPAAFWPEFEVKYWELLTSGKYDEAEAWHAKLLPFWRFRGYVSESNIDSAVFRAAAEYVGLNLGPPRPPFVGLSKEDKDKLFAILKKLGVPKKE